MPTLLRKLDLPHVKLSDTIDGPAIVNYCWCLPLGFGQDYVHKVLSSRYHFDGFEVVQRHRSAIRKRIASRTQKVRAPKSARPAVRV